MNLTEKTINSSLIYDGKVIKVTVDDVELPNGDKGKREVVNHRGGVCISALTDKDELLFVKQFRYPYKEVVLELPAGKLELGDTPLENGKRELKEETGCTGTGYVSLGKFYPSPGYCGEIIHLYFCKVESYGEQNLDDDEFLNVEKIHIDKAVEMVLNNQIPDGKSQTAILKTALMLKELKGRTSLY